MCGFFFVWHFVVVSSQGIYPPAAQSAAQSTQVYTSANATGEKKAALRAAFVIYQTH